jgi:cell division GTPase FtsZ
MSRKTDKTIITSPEKWEKVSKKNKDLMDAFLEEKKREELNILSVKKNNIQKETHTITKEILKNKPFSDIIDYTNIEIQRIYHE